jgi:hypothetical protein
MTITVKTVYVCQRSEEAIKKCKSLCLGDFFGRPVLIKTLKMSQKPGRVTHAFNPNYLGS